MEKFGHYLLANRARASLWAVFFGFIPLMGWLSVVIVALVTLRKGAKPGVWIMLWAILPQLAFLLAGHPWIVLFNIFSSTVLIWIAAVVLRDTVSWRQTLWAMTGIAVAGVLLAHAVYPDLAVWWRQMLLETMQHFGRYAQDSGTAQAQTQQMIASLQGSPLFAWFPRLATGIFSAVTLLFSLINLVIARAWQATLFNPGGLRRELCEIRFGYVALGCLAACALAITSGVTLAWDVLPLVVLLFLFSGLSFAHVLLTRTRWTWLWAALFYLGLILLSPYSLAVVVAIAIVDAVVNFRDRFKLMTN